MVKLNSNNLSLLTAKVKIPAYNRSELKTRIVHIGTGNFYRAHEAFYTDQVISDNNSDWGICGAGIMEADSRMYQVLKSQDGLYTLMIQESDGNLKTSIIGSIVENLFGPENPQAIIEKMADPAVKIISLTITEGGYNFNATIGNFIMSEPDIQLDLHHRDRPKTVFGYLTQALKRRMDRGLSGITILSCDNIQHNGDTCRKMLLSFMKEADPGLMEWTDNNITFPNCMVDRITPATGQSDIDRLKTLYDIEDAWPVVCESFIQWVIEDNFSNGRPPWESAGVRFVKDVSPYEKMKIRLLNAGHSLLGLLGSLARYTHIDDAVRDPLLEELLRKFMDDEVTPLLGEMEGIDLRLYKETLIHRFANPYLKDTLARICSESSAKIPKFLIPTIKEQLGRGGSIEIGAFILAAWCYYLEQADSQGYKYEIKDSMKDILRQRAIDSASSDPMAFLNLQSVFGDLVHSARFAETYIPLIKSLHMYKIEDVIRQVLKIK
jgi:mannitol 2-dehydrogenase